MPTPRRSCAGSAVSRARRRRPSSSTVNRRPWTRWRPHPSTARLDRPDAAASAKSLDWKHEIGTFSGSRNGTGSSVSGNLGGNTPSTDTRAHRRPPTEAAAADRKYLLERVDDAAVVQLYADGFDALPLDQKRLIYHLYAGGARRARHLLRPALRPQPRDARRARGDPHAPGRRRSARRSPRSSATRSCSG